MWLEMLSISVPSHPYGGEKVSAGGGTMEQEKPDGWLGIVYQWAI